MNFHAPLAIADSSKVWHATPRGRAGADTCPLFMGPRAKAVSLSRSCAEAMTGPTSSGSRSGVWPQRSEDRESTGAGQVRSHWATGRRGRSIESGD